jgi:chemotaxis protein CheX
MDVNYVNPFVESFNNVMPQLGFNNIQLGNLSAKDKEIYGSGVIIILGIVGDIKGNVAYMLDTESAKQIASAMMMGMEVEEFDDLAQSALSELTNMLTANAATAFSNIGVRVEISTPTMLQGVDISVKMSGGKVLCIPFIVDSIPIEINIAFEDKQAD